MCTCDNDSSVVILDHPLPWSTVASFWALFLKVPLDIFLTHLHACWTDVCKEKTENTINGKNGFETGSLGSISYSKQTMNYSQILYFLQSTATDYLLTPELTRQVSSGRDAWITKGSRAEKDGMHRFFFFKQITQ